MKGSNATWMMIRLELYWDREITYSIDNEYAVRGPLSAVELIAVVLHGRAIPNITSMVLCSSLQLLLI